MISSTTGTDSECGQTVEELYFAMSEYFGNVYKTISQKNNRTIQENHEQWDSFLH